MEEQNITENQVQQQNFIQETLPNSSGVLAMGDYFYCRLLVLWINSINFRNYCISIIWEVNEIV